MVLFQFIPINIIYEYQQIIQIRYVWLIKDMKPIFIFINFYQALTMADQSQQPCVMCHQSNEQMLMLSCVHDPCVTCAAIHYVQNEPYNSKMYTCAKCGQETELDQSSVAQLRRVYNLQKSRRKPRNPPSTVTQKESRTKASQPASYSRGKQREESHSSSKYQNANPVPQPTYTSNGSKKSQYPCKEHQDEQLTYYCFTCNKPICPQCAIHGLHKDHEVQTTRKAMKQIKDLLLDDKKKLDAQINSLANNRDSSKRLSKQWIDENKRDQQYIKKKFAHLRTVMAEKQRDMLKSTQINLDRNVQILKNQSTASDRALENIMAVNRAIDATLKKDEVTILQEFNKRDEETSQAIRLADRDKDKLREQQIKNPLKALELELFQQDLDRIIGELQNLKLSVAPLKN